MPRPASCCGCTARTKGKRGAAAPRQLSGRGLAYWTDGREERILYVTPGYRLVALDAKTGVPVAGFGKNGIVDLKLDDDQDDRSRHRRDRPARDADRRARTSSSSAPRICPAACRRARRNEKGYVRGFDVRTGKRLWIFHTIPLPGEFGNDTWENDSWSYTGNTGVWAQMTVDEELGLVYLPVELPTGDYYGGHRPGNNLFGESLVARRSARPASASGTSSSCTTASGTWTSRARRSSPTSPSTAGAIKAVAQPTKQAWLYVFDRVTGQPVWPIEERPVEKGDVPGEWYSPTQPFVDQAAAVRSAGRRRSTI